MNIKLRLCCISRVICPVGPEPPNLILLLKQASKSKRDFRRARIYVILNVFEKIEKPQNLCKKQDSDFQSRKSSLRNHNSCVSHHLHILALEPPRPLDHAIRRLLPSLAQHEIVRQIHVFGLGAEECGRLQDLGCE